MFAKGKCCSVPLPFILIYLFGLMTNLGLQKIKQIQECCTSNKIFFHDNLFFSGCSSDVSLPSGFHIIFISLFSYHIQIKSKQDILDGSIKNLSCFYMKFRLQFNLILISKGQPYNSINPFQFKKAFSFQHCLLQIRVQEMKK